MNNAKKKRQRKALKVYICICKTVGMRTYFHPALCFLLLFFGA